MKPGAKTGSKISLKRLKRTQRKDTKRKLKESEDEKT